MKLHMLIQEKMKKMLIAEGYKNVMTERIIPLGAGRFFRVDVYGEKDSEKLIIEIGSSQESRLNRLKSLGYTVRIVPFHTFNEGKYACVCGHVWIPRKGFPKACPACKQYLLHNNLEEGKG